MRENGLVVFRPEASAQALSVFLRFRKYSATTTTMIRRSQSRPQSVWDRQFGFIFASWALNAATGGSG